MQLLNLGEGLSDVWEGNTMDQVKEFLRSELSFERFWEKWKRFPVGLYLKGKGLYVEIKFGQLGTAKGMLVYF